MNTTLNETVNANEFGCEKKGFNTLGRASLHIRRTLLDIADGVSSRAKRIGEVAVADPAEEFAWKLSGKLNHAKTALFNRLDRKIERIVARRAKAPAEQIAVERFDDEGGAMLATQSEASSQA